MDGDGKSKLGDASPGPGAGSPQLTSRVPLGKLLDAGFAQDDGHGYEG